MLYRQIVALGVKVVERLQFLLEDRLDAAEAQQVLALGALVQENGRLIADRALVSVLQEARVVNKGVALGGLRDLEAARINKLDRDVRQEVVDENLGVDSLVAEDEVHAIQ